MAILVTGATGVVGSQVIAHLQNEGAHVHALTRSPEKAKFEGNVTPVKGEIADIAAMRAAMRGIDTLFLLVPNAADELTQALQAMSIAREAGVKGIVYLSVFKGAEYVDVPHFTSKHTVERMVEEMDLPATVLRPAYFIQNDVRQKEALLGHGIYGMPIGNKGISMVDVRDIGDAAARELLRRARSAAPLPRVTFDLVGPDALTSDAIRAIWADALRRPIRYAGDDLDALEAQLKPFTPDWLVYDIRLMMQRYQQDGAARGFPTATSLPRKCRTSVHSGPVSRYGGPTDSAHAGNAGAAEPRRGRVASGGNGGMDTTAGDTPGATHASRSDGPQQGRDTARRDGGGAVDAVGVVVLVCCAVWALVAAAGRPARPEGTLLALLAVTAGYALGRILGALLPVLAPAAAAAAVLALVLIPPTRLSAHPDAPPLGYPNADAALLVLAVGAACCAAWAATGRTWRAALLCVGAGAAVAALALGSAAGFAAGVAIVLCSLTAARMRRRLLGLTAFALAAALAVGGSCAVAVDALPSGLSESLTGQLTQPRVELWHQAVDLAEEHPLRGVGPERFADEAAAAGPDLAPSAESPQSAPLQLAAEQGIPGVALLAAAFAWLLTALWRSPRPTAVVLTAAATLTGLAMLATVDHVLSYAVVTAGAGFLAGTATSRPLP